MRPVYSPDDRLLAEENGAGARLRPGEALEYHADEPCAHEDVLQALRRQDECALPTAVHVGVRHTISDSCHRLHGQHVGLDEATCTLQPARLGDPEVEQSEKYEGGHVECEEGHELKMERGIEERVVNVPEEERRELLVPGNAALHGAHVLHGPAACGLAERRPPVQHAEVLLRAVEAHAPRTETVEALAGTLQLQVILFVLPRLLFGQQALQESGGDGVLGLLHRRALRGRGHGRFGAGP
mmetsp:Transcript_53980/g.144617  ORF Transcript_53980/g.144617 Transcript_53980/m.144617 type:complete len:241 (+) Transcript_53980:974-1696(+)